MRHSDGCTSLMSTVARDRSITVVVNGKAHELYVDPRRSLMDVLREDLDLTGAKKACDGGECGSCTVLLGGRGVMSCLLPISKVGTKEVVTIEGLAGHGSNSRDGAGSQSVGLHPLQRAFAELGAAQCGFCIPGMIMEAQALIDSKPNPTRADIVSRLSRNTCRCTGYTKIVDAVVEAARVIREDPSQPIAVPSRPGIVTETESNHRVGLRVPKPDSFLHVTGASKYAADLKREGMLYAKILRSPHHHARILGIDTSEAEAMPGVDAVVTHKDIPGIKTLVNGRPQLYLFSKDRVRYMGEAVAAVAAVSEAVAEEAIRRIKVEYEALPPVFDSQESMSPDAPLLHPPHANWFTVDKVAKGDVADGFANAAVVVERTYRTSPREHAPMEPEAALAYWDVDGRMVFHSPHHHPFTCHAYLAEMLGLPPDRIRVICPAMGGNFGHRGEFLHAGVVGLLVQKSGKPVRIVYTREESIMSSGKSYSYVLSFKHGVDREGKITAFEAKVIADGGSWIAHPDEPMKGGGITEMVRFVAGPYVIPNALVEMIEVCTNRPRSGPLRGTNVPDFAFAWESQMDLLAEALGMDPLELRIRNAMEDGALSLKGELLDESVSAKATMEALRGPYSEALMRAKSDPPPLPWHRGVGLGCVWKLAGGKRNDGAGGSALGKDLGVTRAAAELLDDGRVRILAGAVEKGQGISIALAQIAAEELDVPLDAIVMGLGDTYLAPYPFATSGQRTMFLIGGAIQKACHSLMCTLRTVAAAKLDLAPDRVTLSDGWALDADSPDGAKLSFGDLAAALHEAGLPAKYEASHVFEKTDKGQGPIFAYASQLVELDVNSGSGAVRVRKVTYVADPGRVINPLTLEGQVEGGVVMGLGYALTERFVPGEVATLKGYGFPTIKDAPEEIAMLHVDRPVLGGPFGAKGSSEITAAAGMAAAANAIADAIGKRIYDMPAVPGTVLAAMRDGA